MVMCLILSYALLYRTSRKLEESCKSVRLTNTYDGLPHDFSIQTLKLFRSFCSCRITVFVTISKHEAYNICFISIFKQNYKTLHRLKRRNITRTQEINELLLQNLIILPLSSSNKFIYK